MKKPPPQSSGLVFGPDGHLYVTSSVEAFGGGTNAILRYDGRTGVFLDAFVPQESGGLSDPRGLVFGPDGHLYVTSAGSNEILRYDGHTGAFLDDFVPQGRGGLDAPRGLVFGLDGHLYVTSAGVYAVLRYDGRTGAPLPVVGASAVFVSGGRGELQSPGELVFGPDGHLYVSSVSSSDFGNSTILRYDGRTGAFLNTLSSK